MTHLTPGDPAPWFTAPGSNNPNFSFSTVAGRFVVLSFFGSAGEKTAARFLELVFQRHAAFDDTNLTFFGVSGDAADRGRLPVHPGGIRYFWDHERAVAKLYGLDGETAPPLTTFILDLTLRVLGVIAEPDPDKHAQVLFAILGRLPKLPPSMPAGPSAPVLVVPRVFEPGFCRHLIELYRTNGGEDSGFMREIDGKTAGTIDHSHKRRRDYTIEDATVRAAAQARIKRRLTPEIKKAFQFDVSRMERYIVACYDASEGGFFRPHRDNTTKGTAHRRFAVTLNLNAEEYEGGDLRFPEFGPQLYRAPTGGAVVFSCSLLHEATPVTKGTRYVFLPFLYDEAAAAVREANNPHLDVSIRAYQR